MKPGTTQTLIPAIGSDIRGDITVVMSKQCVTCTRLRGFACVAFPKGIPKAIFDGNIDHGKPYNGDNGIRFDPIG